MSAMEPLCHLFGINPQIFSQQQNQLLEAELFTRICDELKEVFRQQYKDFFHLMRFTIKKENDMLEANFIKLILKDILTTEEYTLEGIAEYTNIPIDVIYELASGMNTKPLADFFRKVIELHRIVKRELYNEISEKIIAEYSKKIHEISYIYFSN